MKSCFLHFPADSETLRIEWRSSTLHFIISYIISNIKYNVAALINLNAYIN